MKLPVSRKKQTLKRKLFGYMCILAALLCVLLITGLLLIGSFTGTKQRLAKTLSFQSEVFERQIDTYYDGLALMSVQLSKDTTAALEEYLEDNAIGFSELNHSEEHIYALQERLIDELRHKLWEADCTGTFVMLEAQVNPDVSNAASSRTGIYLQRNSLEGSDKRVLLYRGLSQIGKEHDCMPHRKWRLEFDTDLFPSYSELKGSASASLLESYRITDVALLAGTDQHVMLMTIPILSEDGEFWGLCGFELNEGFFKKIFAQPSELERAVFCISKSSSAPVLSDQTLSAGVLNEYYLEPHGDFTAKPFGEGLTEYVGDGASYIGLTSEIRLCPSECTSAVSVLIPKEDYGNMLFGDTLRAALLIITFSTVAVSLSLFFTRRYLQPLKSSLDLIKKKEYAKSTAYTAEISDLFEFLAEQDRINEAERSRLLKEKTDAQSAFNEMQSQFDTERLKAERLAYSRKDEIDPYEYECFKAGIETLTAKEREIFDLYLSGKTAKEITELIKIQESTLKFHNHNMLAKLGVSSRKQMLRFAALMQREEQGSV